MNKKIIILGAALLLCLSGILYFIAQNQSKNNWESADVIEMDTAFSESTSKPNEDIKEEPNEEQKMKVYICGAVVSPGVYEVSEDDRLDDLMDLCGGFCKDADLNDVNLAACLTDGEKIYIMTKKEAKKAAKETHESSDEASDGRVNINTATKEELMTLPGIGKLKAEWIITYREQTARFESIEDIMKIDGIKEGVFKKVKDFIKI